VSASPTLSLVRGGRSLSFGDDPKRRPLVEIPRVFFLLPIVNANPVAAGPSVPDSLGVFGHFSLRSRVVSGPTNCQGYALHVFNQILEFAI
jgi:hypothetical protein